MPSKPAPARSPAHASECVKKSRVLWKTGCSYHRFMSEERHGKARVVEANRAQFRLVPMDLESLLPEDHQARAVWAFVEHLDLGEFYERIRSREGQAGRPATDPQVLLALWIFATLDGVGSARRIERLSREHLAYQWICGGVSVNHHSLSDFRGEAVDLLNGLLTQSVTILMSQGLVQMRRVAQDWMRVRASRGLVRSTRPPCTSAEDRAPAVGYVVQEIEAILVRKQTREAARREPASDRARRIERALEERARPKTKRLNNAKRRPKREPPQRTRLRGDEDGRCGFVRRNNVHFVAIRRQGGCRRLRSKHRHGQACDGAHGRASRTAMDVNPDEWSR